MAFRYEFIEAAARDLFKLTRHNQPLLHTLATEHIPAILKDPVAIGDRKTGDLANVWAYAFRVKGVAYRLVYEVEEDVVVFIAIGTHDVAYQRARRR
jgi:mRNA-degrading endonuclease RelE of RelBE toxin-antitoxin system